MKAIADNYEIEEIASSILENSVDLMIFNHNFKNAVKAFQHLERESKIKPSITEAQKSRIETLISNLHFDTPSPLPDNILEKHEAFASNIAEEYNPKIKEFAGD